MYYCCGITDAGTARKHNEDAYLIKQKVKFDSHSECEIKAPFIAAVADGVAGESSGEVASRMALKLTSRIKPSPSTDYVKKFLGIHKRLQNFGKLFCSENMQTTLCALAVHTDGSAAIINTGDSKLFRYRGGILKQLSKDQSLVQVLYEQGEITAEEKRRHVNRNIIFPVLGNILSEPVIDVREIDGGLEYGDVILICTDGLADYITRGEFENTLALPLNLPKRLEELTRLAKKGGSTDNMTVVAISVI